MFNNPNKANFKVYLPKLMPNDINDTLTKYFFNETTLPFTDLQEGFFDAQITSFAIPDLGLDPVMQESLLRGQQVQLGSRFTSDKYGDNRLIINFKATDGYMNYHLARYAFFIYSNPLTNADPQKTGQMGNIIVNFNLDHALFSFKLVYKNVVWIGVDGKEFSYDTTQQNWDTFGLTFLHNGFDLIPEVNQKIARSKGLVIETGDVNYGKGGKDQIIIRK